MVPPLSPSPPGHHSSSNIIAEELSSSQTFSIPKTGSDAMEGRAESDNGEESGTERRVSAGQQHQELGRGRPGGSGGNGVQQGDSNAGHRLPLLSSNPAVPSSPATTYRSGLSPRRPSSVMSDITTTEDDEDVYDIPRQPLTAACAFPMNAGEQTPRVGATSTVRGMPQTATGSGFGSPSQSSQKGNSASRPSRLPRHHTTGMTQPSSISGSASRSASRARPPLLSNISTGKIDLVGAALRSSANKEDDEVEVRDLGVELIRRRQEERRARKKKEQLERKRRLAVDGTTPEASAPTTGQPDDTFAAQQSRSLGPITDRSVSRTRAASATRGPDSRAPSEGYFAPFAGSVMGSDTPRDPMLSPKDELRAPSIHSSTAEDDEDAAHERASILDEVVQEVVEDELVAGGEDEDAEDEETSGDGEEGVTLKDRQDAINIEHPFGLPIWKPALYRKSRSVTRNAESALHSIPSAAAERHLLPSNLLWVIIFGWWLAIACFGVALLVSGAEVLGGGRGGYGKTLRGLAWYIGWPFGKYVEGEGPPEDQKITEEDGHGGGGEDGFTSVYGTYNVERDGSPVSDRRANREPSDGASSAITVRGGSRHTSALNALPDEPITSPALESAATVRPVYERREPTVSFAASVKGKSPHYANSDSEVDEEDEETPLLKPKGSFRRPRNQRAKMLGRIVYWPSFFLVVAPVMLSVCILCWGLVVTIPMAKLTWALIKLLYLRPLEINFRSAPKVPVPTPHSPNVGSGDESGSTTLAEESPSGFTMKRARLKAGQVAPTEGPQSTVLLCTYRAVGLQYYKYTVGGVNIIFINLLPLVFFTIFDAFVLLPAVEHDQNRGHMPSAFVGFFTSQALIFVLSLASVIPLSYFIGMAVASISAQSSIGMGAVINATFGSIIEIILYSIALTQGKGRLVEGSIVGSILAGVLLMPGASMCSGALKRKEQKFNAKSAGVTSTMLIMAIIGTLTPTMFYQTYGSFQLHCEGCPDPGTSPAGTSLTVKEAWMCDHCYYEHPDPISDPFYQEQVKTLMYGCAAVLLFSYLIGLWFSLRTHASQIWQNPQQLMKVEEVPAGAMHPAVRSTLSQRLTPQAVMQHLLPIHTKVGPSGQSIQSPASASRVPSPKTAKVRLYPNADSTKHHPEQGASSSSVGATGYQLPAGYTPFLETVDRDIKSHVTPMRLPSTLTPEDFTRAVAVATVSALRHQGSIIGSGSGGSGAHKARPLSGIEAGPAHDEEAGEGGHEAPSWNRTVSYGVLLACTLLYAIIAEILVDVVDVVLHGSGIDEKFLGLTLFALVPNTTEFMNAMSFAMNGNIALSMEIGSAYALQVCLLQIPAMVAFSALYDPGKMGAVVDTFTLIFPRWDVIAIILSIFLLTYTYIEARSNYHRGSILVLAYVVLVMGFYYAPPHRQGDSSSEMIFGSHLASEANAGMGAAISMLWA